jgi:endonuclease III
MNNIRTIVNKFGELYSEELGIELDGKKEGEIFKWFLASLLFGKRIGEDLAVRTYKEFEKAGILSPQAIIETGWDGLVHVLDVGGYVRYDFSTADKLLEIMGQLLKEYGSLTGLHKKAKDAKDLENKLMEFKGIGSVTVNIFLRELRHVWPKANPEINPYTKLAAKTLKIDLKKLNRKSKDFVRLECALLRIGKNYIKKNKPLPV